MGEQHQCIQEQRIKALETAQVTLEKAQLENNIYLKVIREDVAEIKQTLKTYSPPPAAPAPVQKEPESKSSAWQPIVRDLIKIVGWALILMGGIAGGAELIKLLK